MQLDLLWNYMKTDMEAEQFEVAMRNAPDRLTLLKQRDFLLEQQEGIKRIEREVAAMGDRLDALKDEAGRLQGLLDAQLKELEDNPPEEAEDIHKQMAAVQKLVESLRNYEQELAKLRRDSEQRDRMQKEIRLRFARTKTEYDELKKTYEVQFAQDKEKLAQLRAHADEEAKKLDPAMMEKYRSVKQHVTPPMAQLTSGRCGVCNMSLPAAVTNKLNTGEMVECDNCGRIIFVPAEG